MSIEFLAALGPDCYRTSVLSDDLPYASMNNQQQVQKHSLSGGSRPAYALSRLHRAAFVQCPKAPIMIAGRRSLSVRNIFRLLCVTYL